MGENEALSKLDGGEDMLALAYLLYVQSVKKPEDLPPAVIPRGETALNEIPAVHAMVLR